MLSTIAFFFRNFCVGLYRRTMYCPACGDEPGTNYECAACRKKMKHRTLVGRHCNLIEQAPRP